MIIINIENFKLEKKNNYLEFVAEFEIDKDYYKQIEFSGDKYILHTYGLDQYVYLEIKRWLSKEIKDKSVKNRMVVDKCVIAPDKDTLTKELI